MPNSREPIDLIEPPVPEQRVSILLVDDQPANLLALGAMLGDLGHNLVNALSGEEALQRLLADDFALVLLDVQMPGLDGFETARLIRGRDSSRRTPIIFLTAFENDRFPVEQAYTLGAVDYLVKPLVPVIVRAKVAGFVELYQKTQQVKRQAERLRQVERREFEQALAQENARLQQQRRQLHVTLASIGDAVIAADAEGRVTFLNPVACSLTGWTQEEATGMPLPDVFQIVNERTRQPVENPAARVLTEGVVVGLANHTVLIARDGTERPIDDSAAPIRDGEGRITGVVLVFRDVTERRRAETELRQSEARKAAVIETALDCIVTIDHEGKVIEFNPAAERTFGYRRADVQGRDIADLILPPRLREAHHRGMAQYLATGEGPVLGKRIEMPAIRADGTEFPVELAITRIPTDGPPLFTAYLRDISERTRIEAQRNTRLAVNHVLAQAGTVEEAATGVLRAVCEGLGWDLGFFWTLDGEAEALRCLESWHLPAVSFTEFEATSRGRTFGKGEGLPGHVWATGTPVWILDVLHDANFPRVAAAAREGLHGAFGCPIVLGAEPLGVIEFFSRRIREPDADLLEMMATVAGQIGQFMERRRAEEQLRRSERELADFFDNATIGLHWVGPDGTILRANQAELDLLGYSAEEYVGHHIAEFHADEGVICDILRRLQAGERLHDYPARMRCKDGSTRDVLIHSSVLWEDGQFVHTRCFTRDVTEQKKAEEALRETEQRFARFMQHLPGLAWIKDVQGRYVYVNDAAEKAFRKPRAELYGKTDEEVFPPATAAQFRQNDQRALVSRTGVQVIETLEDEQGVLRHSVVSKFPILGPDGRPGLVGGMAIDITDRLRAEEALKEEARRKDEFLATLAHELRNPLAPIRNSLHIMKQPGERALGRIVRIVDDLLDISRITKGKIALRKERLALQTAVHHAVESVRPFIDSRRHALTVSLPAEAVWLEADPVRIEQVIVNLLNNAAKYTEPGGKIWVSAERLGNDCVLKVKDTGIGIKEEMLPRIFELFVQADKSLDRAEGGLGIGLTLVKRLVEMHGGAVEAHSGGVGQGSEFIVRLVCVPEVAGLRPEAAPAQHRQAKSRRVLVVDDNVDTAESLAMLLRLLGHEVAVEHSGPKALQAAVSGKPDVVLMDLGLPGMDGYQVAERIRQHAELVPVRLIAISGYGQESDKERSRLAGFDQHLVKPVDPAKLQDVL